MLLLFHACCATIHVHAAHHDPVRQLMYLLALVHAAMQISCSLLPSQPECSCTLSYIKSQPGQCMSGDYDYARGRAMHQV